MTTPARTLLDLATELTPRALERATDEAARLELCGHDELVQIVAAHPRHPGAPRVKRLLESHEVGSTATREGLEEFFLELCDRHRLPRPEVNVPVGSYIADFLWRDHDLIVETDDRSHTTRKAFEADRVRDAELTLRGYRVIRFTYRQVLGDEARVVRTLRALLAD